MNAHITKAIELSINLHESIDSYRLNPDTKVKHEAVGQCLRSLMEMLQNEHEHDTTT